MTKPIVTSITDEQLEEFEQHVNRVDHAGTDMVETDFNEQRALLARLRAAEKDAERYRWLREFIDQSPQAIEHLPCSDGDLIDEVIDAAMERPA